LSPSRRLRETGAASASGREGDDGEIGRFRRTGDGACPSPSATGRSAPVKFDPMIALARLAVRLGEGHWRWVERRILKEHGLRSMTPHARRIYLRLRKLRPQGPAPR